MKNSFLLLSLSLQQGQEADLIISSTFHVNVGGLVGEHDSAHFIDVKTKAQRSQATATPVKLLKVTSITKQLLGSVLFLILYNTASQLGLEPSSWIQSSAVVPPSTPYLSRTAPGSTIGKMKNKQGLHRLLALLQHVWGEQLICRPQRECGMVLIGNVKFQYTFLPSSLELLDLK